MTSSTDPPRRHPRSHHGTGPWRYPGITPWRRVATLLGGVWHPRLAGNSIGRLVNLEFLNIGHNELTGPIPVELGNLTNLERFGVHANNLQGSIPSWLGSLSNMTIISLHESGLSGSLPS